MKIAILLPTKGRAEQMKQRVNDLLLQPVPDGVYLSVVLAICHGDRATWEAASRLCALWDESDVTLWIVKRPSSSNAVDGWNRAHQAFRDRFDWFILGADDLIWHEGWLEAAVALANEPQVQVIGLNDLHTNLDNYGPHYMVHKDFIQDAMGGWFIPPVYQSWWFDREVCEVARQRGVYAPGVNVIVEHAHPDWGNAAMDATYKDAWHLHDEDKQVYLARRAAGYPPVAKELV